MIRYKQRRDWRNRMPSLRCKNTIIDIHFLRPESARSNYSKQNNNYQYNAKNPLQTL